METQHVLVLYFSIHLQIHCVFVLVCTLQQLQHMKLIFLRCIIFHVTCVTQRGELVNSAEAEQEHSKETCIGTQCTNV